MAKGKKTPDLSGLPKGSRLRISHPESGKSYGVSVKAYETLYADRGFQVDSLEDGTPLRLSKGEEEAAEATHAAEAASEAGSPEE